MKGGARWIGFEAASVPHMWKCRYPADPDAFDYLDVDVGWMREPGLRIQLTARELLNTVYRMR
jgi:hypothetical protein